MKKVLWITFPVLMAIVATVVALIFLLPQKTEDKKPFFSTSIENLEIEVGSKEKINFKSSYNVSCATTDETIAKVIASDAIFLMGIAKGNTKLVFENETNIVLKIVDVTVVENNSDFVDDEKEPDENDDSSNTGDNNEGANTPKDDDKQEDNDKKEDHDAQDPDIPPTQNDQPENDDPNGDENNEDDKNHENQGGQGDENLDEGSGNEPSTPTEENYFSKYVSVDDTYVQYQNGSLYVERGDFVYLGFLLNQDADETLNDLTISSAKIVQNNQEIEHYEAYILFDCPYETNFKILLEFELTKTDETGSQTITFTATIDVIII